MVEALDIRETVTTPAGVLRHPDATRGRRGCSRPRRSWRRPRRSSTATRPRAILNIHAPDPTVTAKLAAALKADVTGAGGQAAGAECGDLRRPARARRAGHGRVADAQRRSSTSSRSQFANGVRALIFPSTSETGRVYVRVRFGGGYNALPPNRAERGLGGAAGAGAERRRQAGAGRPRPARRRAADRDRLRGERRRVRARRADLARRSGGPAASCSRRSWWRRAGTRRRSRAPRR